MKPVKLQRNKHRSQDLFWKVHDRAQSLVLYSYTLAELRSRQVSIGEFLGPKPLPILFCARSRPKTKQNKTKTKTKTKTLNK